MNARAEAVVVVVVVVAPVVGDEVVIVVVVATASMAVEVEALKAAILKAVEDTATEEITKSLFGVGFSVLLFLWLC